MIIKLLSKQIPTFWDVIKSAAVGADEIAEEHLQPYLNELLQELLSDKAQCFVHLDENRILIKLMVTEILGNKVTGEKYLDMKLLYSFKPTTNDDVWREEFAVINEFAIKEQCVYICGRSRNPRVWEITKFLGFKETNRSFKMKVGDMK